MGERLIVGSLPNEDVTLTGRGSFAFEWSLGPLNSADFDSWTAVGARQNSERGAPADAIRYTKAVTSSGHISAYMGNRLNLVFNATGVGGGLEVRVSAIYATNDTTFDVIKSFSVAANGATKELDIDITGVWKIKVEYRYASGSGYADGVNDIEALTLGAFIYEDR